MNKEKLAKQIARTDRRLRVLAKQFNSAVATSWEQYLIAKKYVEVWQEGIKNK